MMPVDATDLVRILPEIILSGFAILVMLLDPFFPLSRKFILGWVSLLGVLGAGTAAVRMSFTPGAAFAGTVAADVFSLYFIYLFLLVAALTLLGSIHYLERDHLQRGEFYALLLMATVGMCFMAASTELVMIFLGLEISSLATYILAGFKRHEVQSNEASLKYFLLGSFATAFFLYGIAFVYGATGTTNLNVLADAFRSSAEWPPLASVALILMFVGLAFKVSTAPFHVWTPDVYQGAPGPVTAFLAVGPKAAAFAALLRIFLGSMALAGPMAFWMIWLSAALTMTVGNLAALAQPNLKRMLAYSSIAHAGYILVGLAAGKPEGTSAVLFYLTAYALMNAGAFVLIAHLAGADEKRLLVEDYSGLAFERPGVAACLTVLLLSLAGFPATAGFLGKFYLFRAAVHSDLIGLTVIAVLNSVVSVYYYLRPVVVMYMREGPATLPSERVPWALRAALAVAVAGIFYLGLFPNYLLTAARLASPLP